MQPHQERVVTEKQDLDEKLAKLKAFCLVPGNKIFDGLSAADKELLLAQHSVMEKYSEILHKRIAAFK
jgi:hypothetical protein